MSCCGVGSDNHALLVDTARLHQSWARAERLQRRSSVGGLHSRAVLAPRLYGPPTETRDGCDSSLLPPVPVALHLALRNAARGTAWLNRERQQREQQEMPQGRTAVGAGEDSGAAHAWAARLGARGRAGVCRASMLAWKWAQYGRTTFCLAFSYLRVGRHAQRTAVHVGALSLVNKASVARAKLKDQSAWK